jgi:tetratricopeptide (TPR) repeat protein
MIRGAGSFAMNEYGEPGNRRVERWTGPALFALAFALYLATGARRAVPGDSSFQLAHHLGCLPLASMLQPVWGGVVRALAWVSWPSIAGAVTVMGGLCAAGVVWLVYSLTAHIRQDAEGTPRVKSAGRLAGASAALWLTVCIPFWFVATRPHAAPFDLLLLLGSLRLLQRHGETGLVSYLYGATALFGISLPEYGTSLAMLPVFTVYALVQMVRGRQLRPNVLLKASLCSMAAPAVYLAAGWYYAQQPMAEWRELGSFLGLVKVMILEQIALIRRSVPRVGWITVFIAACLPWLACVVLVRSGRRVEHGAGTLLLYLVMAVVAATILFDGPFAPWRLLGQSPLLLVPYLLTASYFGLALGGALLILDGARLRQRRAPPAWWRPAFLLVAIGVAAAAGPRNFSRVDTRSAADLREVTARLVSCLEGRDVLLTDGSMDALIALEAWDARVPLHIISLPMMHNSTYRHLLGWITGSPRIAALSRAGVWPALSTWMRTDEDATRRLAVSFTPNFWLMTGFTPLPNKMLYLGLRDTVGVDSARLIADHEAFWSAARPALDRLAGDAAISRALRLQIAAVANDLGVFLENARQAGLAERAYDAALEINPESLSATANRGQLWAEAGKTNEAAGAWARVTELRAKEEHAVPLMILAERDGHLRTQSAAEHVVNVVAPAQQPAAPLPALTDAVLKHLQGQSEEARALAEKLVEQQPDRDEAWLLLAAIAVDMKDDTTFQRCLNHMRDQNKEWPEMLLILGQKAMAREDHQSAREYYERAAMLRPDNPRIHEMLLHMDLQGGNLATAERRVRALLNLNPASLSANYALGVILAKRGEYELAESSFRYLIERRRDPLVLNNLAWLLLHRGALDEALALSVEAAELMPRVYSVWDTQGAILLQLGRLEEAEASLNKAAELNARSVDVRIHRAQLALKQGKAAEARAAAREMLAAQETLDEDQREALEELADD